MEITQTYDQVSSISEDEFTQNKLSSGLAFTPFDGLSLEYNYSLNYLTKFVNDTWMTKNNFKVK